MALKELTDYIVSLFGPEILIYTVYLIAEIILVNYNCLIKDYVCFPGHSRELKQNIVLLSKWSVQ